MFKTRKRYGRSIGDLRDYAEVLYVSDLVKTEIKLDRTVISDEHKVRPDIGKNMIDIENFWSKDGCKMNSELYRKVISTKNQL